MKRSLWGRSLFTLMLACGLPIFFTSPSTQAELEHGTYVILTQDFLDVGSGKLARAFIETDSGSPIVLCSINENDPGYGPLRLAGLLVLCRARSLYVDNVELHGIGVAVIFPVLFDTRRGFQIHVSVVQDGATSYGDPMLCPDC